jgi:hypothetical protein
MLCTAVTESHGQPTVVVVTINNVASFRSPETTSLTRAFFADDDNDPFGIGIRQHSQRSRPPYVGNQQLTATAERERKIENKHSAPASGNYEGRAVLKWRIVNSSILVVHPSVKHQPRARLRIF